MTDFSKEIHDFQKNGIYVYNFDEGGNLTFNSSSSDFYNHYLSFPLKNYLYDNVKIKSFYDLEFKEFISSENDVKSEVYVDTQVSKLETENKDLKTQLDELIKNSELNPSQSQILAIKQVILELRIALKQGKAETDFADTFPYLPIIKNTR